MIRLENKNNQEALMSRLSLINSLSLSLKTLFVLALFSFQGVMAAHTYCQSQYNCSSGEKCCPGNVCCSDCAETSGYCMGAIGQACKVDGDCNSGYCVSEKCVVCSSDGDCSLGPCCNNVCCAVGNSCGPNGKCTIL